MMPASYTRKLLAECVEIMAQHGPDSQEVKDFIRSHQEDCEFLRLAEMSRKLKKETLPPKDS